MDAELASFTCRLPGCGGPRSGVCINNLPFDECPDVVPAEGTESRAAEPTSASPSPASVPDVRLRGGRSLDAAACDVLLRQRGGTVVGLVAGPEVGKTTLIATMYELLHRRRMSAFGFAGSETLRGYEERCHLARIASNAAWADTQHTPTKAQLSFTHLRVATAEGVKEVVFSDRSGEHFDNALSRPGLIADFVELARANAVMLLVDLAELLKSPHVHTSNVRRLFMAMDQNGFVEGKTFLLVGTKADLAAPTPRSSRAGQALQELAVDLSGRSKSGAVEPLMVASRPRKGSSVIGEGLEQLLSALLTDRPKRKAMPANAWPQAPNDLDKLMRGFRARSS